MPYHMIQHYHVLIQMVLIGNYHYRLVAIYHSDFEHLLHHYTCAIFDIGVCHYQLKFAMMSQYHHNYWQHHPIVFHNDFYYYN